MPFAVDAAQSAQVFCTPHADDTRQNGIPIITLPAKATVTPPEAARALGISARQIRYLVKDGTLLAIDASRHPAGGKKTNNTRTPWRVVVRRGAEFSSTEFKAFQTLEEFARARSNLES